MILVVSTVAQMISIKFCYI